MAESTSLVPIHTYLRNGLWDLPTSDHVDVMEVRRKVSSVQIHSTDLITCDGIKLITLKSRQSGILIVLLVTT